MDTVRTARRADAVVSGSTGGAATHTVSEAASSSEHSRDAPAGTSAPTAARALARSAVAHVRHPLFSTAYSLMLSTVLTGAVGVAFWAVAAREYEPGVLGENAALIAAMMTVSTFAQLDLAWMLMRFLPRLRRRAGRAIGLSYVAATVAGVLLSIVVLLLAKADPSNLGFLHEPGIFLLFVASVVTWSVFAVQDGVLTGLGRAVVVPIENGAFAVAKLVLLIGFVVLFPRWGIFLAWILPVLVSLLPINALIFGRYLPRHRARAPHPEPIDGRAIARYVGYDYVAGLCGAVSTIGMPLIVTALLGTTANAHFYIAWMLVLIVDAITVSLGSSLLVQGSYEPAELRQHACRVVRRGALLVGPIVLVVLVGAPLILQVFGSEYAESSASVLRILVLGIVPRGLLMLYATIARVQGLVRSMLVVVVISTVLLVALVVALAGPFGLEGVAAGWVAGYLIVAVAVWPQLHRFLRHGTPLHGHRLAPVASPASEVRTP